MYDPVKTPSISSIYSYNHLPPLLFSFIFHPSSFHSSSTPPWVTTVCLSPLPKYWQTASHPSLSTNGGGPFDKMVEKKVQKMVQKVVQKKVHKIVQGSNGPVHILPHAISMT